MNAHLTLAQAASRDLTLAAAAARVEVAETRESGLLGSTVSALVADPVKRAALAGAVLVDALATTVTDHTGRLEQRITGRMRAHMAVTVVLYGPLVEPVLVPEFAPEHGDAA